MKRLVALLLTLTMVFGTLGLTAVGAEETLTEPTAQLKAPTFSIENGVAKLKAGDGRKDYTNVYAYVYTTQGWSTYVGFTYDEKADAYVADLTSSNYSYYTFDEKLSSVSFSKNVSSDDNKSGTVDEAYYSYNDGKLYQARVTSGSRAYQTVKNSYSYTYSDGRVYENEYDNNILKSENIVSKTENYNTDSGKVTSYAEETTKKEYVPEKDEGSNSYTDYDYSYTRYNSKVNTEESDRTSNSYRYNSDYKLTYVSEETAKTSADDKTKTVESATESDNYNSDGQKTSHEAVKATTTSNTNVEFKYTDSQGKEQTTKTDVVTQRTQDTTTTYYDTKTGTESQVEHVTSERTGDEKGYTSTSKTERSNYNTTTEKKTSDYSGETTSTYVTNVSQYGWVNYRQASSSTESETKYYGKDETVNERVVATSAYTYNTEGDNYGEMLSSKETSERYNKDNNLTYTRNYESGTTYNDAKDEKTYQSAEKTENRNDYGVLTSTSESSTKTESKLVEEKHTYSDGTEYTTKSWEQQSSTSDTVRKNAEGKVVYSSNSTSKGDESSSETMSYDKFGTLSSGSKSNSTKTTSHSESYNRYGINSTTDTTRNEDGYIVKTTTVDYNNFKDGKNVKSYEYISEPEYMKAEDGSIERTLTHTKSYDFDNLGGYTSSSTVDQAYSEKDDTVTTTETTINYVGKPVEAEMHDKVVSITVTNAKSSDYSTIRTTYDWDGSVEKIYKSARETVTDKNGNDTITTTDATFEKDGTTLISGQVSVNGYDENGNSYNSYSYANSEGYRHFYEYGIDADGNNYRNEEYVQANGTSSLRVYGYDKDAKKYTDVTTYYNADAETVGKLESGVSQFDKDKKYIGYDDIYTNAKGEVVYKYQVRVDAEGKQTYSYVDADGKEIGYRKTDDDKGVYESKIPTLNTEEFTLVGWEEITRTETKGKDSDGEEITYTVVENKYYNKDEVLTRESKDDQLGVSYTKYYTSEGKLTLSNETDAKGQKTDTYYENPGDVLSKVVKSNLEAEMDEETGLVTSQVNSDVAYYGLDGKLDRHTIETVSYEYDKDGNTLKTTTTTEYRDGTDKAVVTKTDVNDVTDKNNWKQETTTVDGTVIGYVKYSGYETEKVETTKWEYVEKVDTYGNVYYNWEEVPVTNYEYSSYGTREELAPTINEYTGKVLSTVETKAVTDKDGNYTSNSVSKDDGEITREYSYSRDADGNTATSEKLYNNTDNHLSSEWNNSYDAETKVTKADGTNYRYSGSVASSWTRESAYDKDQDLTITTEEHFNSDGKLVYTVKTQDKTTASLRYYTETISNSVYTDAQGNTIGYSSYDAEGNYTSKIPGTTYSGNLSGSWTESTRSADGKTSTSKTYDKNGVLTNESSATAETSLTKSYWSDSTVAKKVEEKSTLDNGMTKTVTSVYNEDGSLRTQVVETSGRATGTHFETTSKSYYGSDGTLLYSYEYQNDLQKDESKGVYLDASGKEIGHDMQENKDGSSDELRVESVNARTGEIESFYEYGYDKDGNYYSVSYDKDMNVISRRQYEENEDGDSIYVRYADGFEKPISIREDGVTTYYDSKGESIRSYEYSDDFDNAIIDSEWIYYNQNGELTYSELGGVKTADNRNTYTLYLGSDGEEIGRTMTDDDGNWISRTPQTTFANNIYGYYEQIRQDDDTVSIIRNYDKDNNLKTETWRKTTTEITDAATTTTTTNKDGMVTEVRISEKDLDNNTTKVTTRTFNAYNGRYEGEWIGYYTNSEYDAYKNIDENGNLTVYGLEWNNNDYHQSVYSWVNGNLNSYSWYDTLNSNDEHAERYHADGTYASWYDGDKDGNYRSWNYYNDGALYSYTESVDDVTSTTYYNRDGSVRGYDWNVVNTEYWDGNAQDSEVWNATSLLYKKHVESNPDDEGIITTWTDNAGNVKTIVDNYEDDVVSTVKLAKTDNGWQQAFGDEWYYVDNGILSKGWKVIDGTWYYFNDDGSMATGRVKDGSTVYVLDQNGAWAGSGWNQDKYGNWAYVNGGTAVTGWQLINGTWYYFDEGWYINSWGADNELGWYEYTGGTMVTGAAEVWNSDWSDTTTYFFKADGSWDTSAGWKTDGVDKYYFFEGGTRATGWNMIDGTWYYFNDKGVMRNGWVGSGPSWYYMKEDGSMAAGEWIQERFEDDWYYAEDSGLMATGWRNIGGAWYYFDASGVMATDEWVGNYYQDENGMMVTGWNKIDGDWYYMGGDGEAQYGWQNIGGTWYYFDSSAAMVTGEVEINGQINVFDGNGAWQGTK